MNPSPASTGEPGLVQTKVPPLPLPFHSPTEQEQGKGSDRDRGTQQAPLPQVLRRRRAIRKHGSYAFLINFSLSFPPQEFSLFKRSLSKIILLRLVDSKGLQRFQISLDHNQSKSILLHKIAEFTRVEKIYALYFLLNINLNSNRYWMPVIF